MHRIAFAILALLGILTAQPASAQGEIVITHAKALAGNVTPGDTPGYPVTLSLPGAYMLGSILSVPSNVSGIVVNSHNVDIDMNGFLLTGNGVARYALITGHGESRIHNGIINGFGYGGLYIRNNAWTIEDMKIVRNGGSGIDATGVKFVAVRDSLVASNGNYGIIAGDFGFFRNNTVSENAYTGIRCSESCHVEGNIVSKNSYGINPVNGLISGNTIVKNAASGIFDDGDIDTGAVNNILIYNEYSGAPGQVVRGVSVNPNKCIGPPCAHLEQ